MPATNAIARHKSAYLMAVGGAAYLVARAIKGSKVVGFEDLGMEAIYEFEVQDMPVPEAVDSEGHSAHHLAPLGWREKIGKATAAEGAAQSTRPRPGSPDKSGRASGGATVCPWGNIPE